MNIVATLNFKGLMSVGLHVLQVSYVPFNGTCQKTVSVSISVLECDAEYFYS